MTRFAAALLFSLLAVFTVGCEEPVVVTPDADDDTTIIEERDVEVDPTPTTPPPQSDTGVQVDVGGGEGVDVDVNPGAGDSTAPTNDPGPNQ